jgi:hypothetical protein
MKNGLKWVGLAMLFFPTVLLADDLQFSANTAINFKTGQYVPKVDPDTGFKFMNTTLDLGFTMFTSRYYVALNYDTTIKEDYTVINKGTIEVETTRLDQGITAGYDIGGGLGVFLGYKTGRTEQDTVRTIGTTAKLISFYDKGPFAGVSYGHSFGKAGSFSASLAYANMDGEIRVTDELTTVTQRTTGTTSGLSYGIKWTKEVREGRTLAIGFKQHDYRFKDKDMGLGGSQDLDQKFDIIYVQMSDFFN